MIPFCTKNQFWRTKPLRRDFWYKTQQVIQHSTCQLITHSTQDSRISVADSNNAVEQKNKPTAKDIEEET